MFFGICGPYSDFGGQNTVRLGQVFGEDGVKQWFRVTMFKSLGIETHGANCEAGWFCLVSKLYGNRTWLIPVSDEQKL